MCVKDWLYHNPFNSSSSSHLCVYAATTDTSWTELFLRPSEPNGMYSNILTSHGGSPAVRRSAVATQSVPIIAATAAAAVTVVSEPGTANLPTSPSSCE